MRSPRLLLPALLAVLLLSGCTSLESTGDKKYVTGDGTITQVDGPQRDPAVQLTGTDLDGKPLDLADFRGKPVVVSVWGAWCVECRAEQDTVDEAAADLDGVARFVGINVRDPSADNAKSYVRSFGVTYPSFYSPGSEALLQFPGTLSPRTVPAFVVLDAQGRIAASILGQLPSRRTLVDLVEEVAAESDATQGSAGSVDG